MADTQQRDDEAVSACLGQDTVSRIDQNDGQVRSAGACCHVACVLLVAWRVGNDECAFYPNLWYDAELEVGIVGRY